MVSTPQEVALADARKGIAMFTDPKINVPVLGIVENMALAATDLGAGACHIWGAVMALSHQPDLVTALELPEGFIPACGLVVGETSDSYSVRNVDTGKIGVNYLK